MVLTKFTRRSNGYASSSSVLDDKDTSSACGGGMSVYSQRVAVLEKVAVSLHESRASTREAALASLVGALVGFVPAHSIGWYYRDEILRGCCACIKRGAAKEARLALRAVALLAITLGPGSKRRIVQAETYNPLDPSPGSKKIMAETYPLVSRILEVSTDESLVIAALECLAVVAFVDVAFVDVAVENMDDTEACMNALWGLICPSTGAKVAGAAKKTSARVLAAAVSAWTLVLTTGWWKKKVSPALWRGTVAFLVSLLHSDSREVRMAAGEALAVSIEMKLLTRQKNGTLFSEMEDRASDLSIEDGRAFVEQKELFMKITTFLANGKAPESSVHTSSSNCGLLTTSTWAEMVRLNFLRRFLGSGFLHHLQGKGLMGEVFVIDDDEVTGKLSAARSKRSLRTLQLNDKEKKQEMIKKSLEKQRKSKKERVTAYDLKHGLLDQ